MKRRLRLSTVLIVLIGLWSITLVTSMNWSFSNYARHGKEVINTNQWVGIEDMGFTYDWEEYPVHYPTNSMAAAVCDVHTAQNSGITFHFRMQAPFSNFLQVPRYEAFRPIRKTDVTIGRRKSAHVFFPGCIYWFALMLPLLSYRVYTSRHLKASKGLCVYCGYDMRATPSQCPECGRARWKTRAEKKAWAKLFPKDSASA